MPLIKPKIVPDVKQSQKSMVGMSPIISFRALNRMALNNNVAQSQQDSTLSSEKIKHDSNSSLSSHKNQRGIWNEEESKIDEAIKTL